MIDLLHSPKLIVGAGGASWWILEGFNRNNLRIEGFLVTDVKWARNSNCGLQVWDPSNWDLLPLKKTEYILIIGIMNPIADFDKIKKELKSSGWKNIFTFAEYAKELFHETGVNCCMLDPAQTFSDPKSIDKARALLSDQKSKHLFDAFLRFVSQLEDPELSLIDTDPYFPLDLPRWPEKLRMFDVGSFDGDTVRQAVLHGYQIDQAFCFEPDDKAFKALTSNKILELNILNIPMGISDSTKQLIFSDSGDTGSRVIPSGGRVVQCTSIDEFAPYFHPNLLKMDIEGSEQSALHGARRTITQSRPHLAISIYHLSTDIWKLPIYISELLGPECGYYLRKHSHGIADTVLYVFP